jgi:hypothetical protein
MKGHFLLGAAVSVIGALAPLACAEAAPSAEAAAMSTAGSDAQISDAAVVKELERRLDQRDAVIRDLMARVERLEHQEAARAAAPAAPAAAAPQQAQAAPPPPTASAPPPAAVAQVSPPHAAGPPGAAPKPGPGSFEVSEEAAQRALERALVQTGAALLPAFKFEFVPSVFYQYQRISTPGEIALTTDGKVLITENVLKSTQVQASALLRVGLPWDLQAEVGVPFDYKDNTVVTRANGAGLAATGPSVSGVGDPSISLTKQILAENDLRPGMFVNLGWNPNAGQVKEKTPLGKGFDQFTGGFTLVKRQDPLVFTGGLTYVHARQNNGFRPGDQYVGLFGILLAISPETSLQFGQQLIFYGQDTFNGQSIPGSNRTAGIFNAGVVTVLGRNRVVVFSVGIGETIDSPNIVVSVSVPIRLN